MSSGTSRAVVAETLDRCADEPEPRACDYRLVDMSGIQRRVVLAVAGDGDGDVSGFLVDVTAARDALLAERVNAELDARAGVARGHRPGQGRPHAHLRRRRGRGVRHPQAELPAAQHPPARARRPGGAGRGRGAGLDDARAARRDAVRDALPRRSRRPGSATSTCAPSAATTSRSCASPGRSTCPTGTSWPTRSRWRCSARWTSGGSRWTCAGWAGSGRPSSTCSRRPCGAAPRTASR